MEVGVVGRSTEKEDKEDEGEEAVEHLDPFP